MKYYEQLLDKGCFSRDDLCAMVGNYNTVGTLLKNYLKKGYIQKVKRNLYVAINLADRQPVVSKYHIAGSITKSAYISHHAAFEYYGCANQVSYQVEVSSETSFTDFSFNGNNYAFFSSRISDGIIMRHDGVRATDIERTVIDSINDFNKVAGLEELLRCIELIPSLDDEKLLSYLFSYNKQILFQKTGYILQHYKHMLRLSDMFFVECAARIGKSTRYLTKSTGNIYNSEWRLIVPDNLNKITDKGVDYDAAI
ncbi:MAG: transcriptional regulator [Oscillospiraceae bacterium]|nr:transcriptional regulator [Oscillospiraceae bacterium]MCL2279262.1 transcriptional regulator [Oscillospiraceae bacterium]